MPRTLVTAFQRLERAGLIPLMENDLHISSTEVAAAAEQDMLIFPTKAGGSEQRTL
jgi:hypothetical protein